MIIVITGVNGFSGKYFTHYLLKNTKANRIIGIDIHADSINRDIEYYSTTDFNKFQNSIINTSENVVFYHIGGLIGNYIQPELIEANVYWTSKYLHVASQIKNLELFLNIGSSAEYGKQEETLMIEGLAPSPINNYGISKYLQSKLVFQYGSIYGLPVASTRTFNLIGPGLGDNLVIGKIINEFNLIAQGKKEAVEMGRTDSMRDFIDVRDAVQIYIALANSNSCAGNTINVARGKSYKIDDIIKICKSIYKINPEIKNIYNSPKAQDLDQQFADISKMTKLIGSHEFIPLEQSIEDMMNYGRK